MAASVHGPGGADPADADWARLRAIAEQGRQRPLLGGRPLVIWGVAIAVAAIGHWAIQTRLVPAPLWVLAPWWFVLTAGAAVLAGIAMRRDAGGTGVASIGNQVSEAVWRMGGTFLGALALGLVIFAAWASGRGVPEAWLLMAAMPPVTFGVYGIALAATAVAAEARWLRAYAWASLGFSVAAAVTIGMIWQFAVMAAGALVVSVLPGMRMLRTGKRG